MGGRGGREALGCSPDAAPATVSPHRCTLPMPHNTLVHVTTTQPHSSASNTCASFSVSYNSEKGVECQGESFPWQRWAKSE